MNVGTSLNHYRIVAPLGEGGMGQVYRAQDTRLKRQVAIKVLPRELAADPERLARLEREAQLLAQLEHPNVAAVYGLEESQGTRFLVMQLVEGETLADRIAEAPVPVKSAMSIALQIAEGLEAAHERGIIHRDLKPANIMVSAEGAVKILDFGLAKAGDASASGMAVAVDLTASPTMMAPTQAGMILGTAAYMSPEQARGKAVDKRTDIWAFGCVLYEMLVGRQGFGGETVTDILAAIVHKQPDLDDLPADTPWRLRELIERCLEKDPVQRLRDIGDARIALARAIADPASGHADGATAAPAGGSRRWLRTAAVAAGAVALTAAAMSWFAPRAADRPIRRFALHSNRMVDVRDRDPKLSPDGSRVLFYSDDRLWVRDLSQTEARPLEGTQEATYPIWSPDGQHIAFFAGGALWRMPAAGGDRQRLTSVGEVEDAFWGDDGQIYFGLDPDIAVVSDHGGDPRVIIRLDDMPLEPGDGGLDLHEPFLLPDGRSILFRYHTQLDAGGMMVWDGESARQLLPGSNQEVLRAPMLAPTGHILYERLGVDNPGIWAVRFDVGSLSLVGDPFLIEPGATRISLGPEGAALIVEGGVAETFQLVWVNLDGTLGEPLGAPFQADPFRLAVSPQGDRVAMVMTDGQGADLWIADDRGGTTRLTSQPGMEVYPSWDPERNRVVYSRIGQADASSPEVWAQPLDGTGAAEKIVDGFRGSVSADGRVLVFERRDSPEASTDLWFLDLDEGGEPQRLTDTPFDEVLPTVSPDGALVAVISDESGQPEIHVRSFPAGDDRRVISTGEASNPIWSPSGDRLYFVSNNDLMFAQRDAGGRFGPPTLALSARMPGLLSVFFNNIIGYGIGPDGDRVLVPSRAPDQEAPTMVLVENWLSQLRGRS